MVLHLTVSWAGKLSSDNVTSVSYPDDHSAGDNHIRYRPPGIACKQHSPLPCPLDIKANLASIMYFNSVFPILAVFFSACVSLVFCDESNTNVGFRVSINFRQIQVYDEYGHPQNSTNPEDAMVASGTNSTRPSSSYSTFFVPVTITRISTDINSLTLRLSTRRYDYDEYNDQQETEVYQQLVNMEGQTTHDTITTFNISTESIGDVVYSLCARLDIDGSIEGGRDIQTISDAAVLSYNSSSETWTTADPADFAHQDNEVVHAEYASALAYPSQAPIDTTSDTIITDQEPDEK